jgi:hypothetical protein
MEGAICGWWAICAAGERGATANANHGDGGRFAAGGRFVGAEMATIDPAERGEPREESGGGDGGVRPSISTRGPFFGAAARGWRCAGLDLP